MNEDEPPDLGPVAAAAEALMKEAAGAGVGPAVPEKKRWRGEAAAGTAAGGEAAMMAEEPLAAAVGGVAVHWY